MQNHNAGRLMRLVATALISAVAMLLVACGGDDEKPADSSGSAAGEASAKLPEKIRIGYQVSTNTDLIVKRMKLLEAEMPGVTIEWKLFDSGGSVNEAMASGGIDFGLAGSSPVSRGISQGLAYQVPWIFSLIGAAEALVVKEGITSVADLKGKKVATPFASTADYSMIAAIQDAGLTLKDVKLIDGEPDDILAAWQRDDIQGAYIWNPNLAKMKEDGGTVLIDSGQLAEKGKATYDLAVVANEFAEQYPEAVNRWAKAQDKAVELYETKPDEAAAAVAAELNITAEEALAQMKDLVFLRASDQIGADYLGGGLGKSLTATAAFNKERGEIETVESADAYAKAVNPAYAKAASGG